MLLKVLVDRQASLSCHDLVRIFPSGGLSVMATGGEGKEGRKKQREGEEESKQRL